jgi:hypothetical protein
VDTDGVSFDREGRNDERAFVRLPVVQTEDDAGCGDERQTDTDR